MVFKIEYGILYRDHALPEINTIYRQLFRRQKGDIMKKKIVSFLLAFTLISSSCVETVFASPQSSDSQTGSVAEEHGTSYDETQNAEAEQTHPSPEENDAGTSSSPGESISTSESGASDIVSQNQKTAPALTIPELISAENISDGISLVWNSIDGADGYRILRKTEAETWSTVGNFETSDGTEKTVEYSDLTVSSGVTYTYTVQAYRGAYEEACANEGSEEYWSGYNTSGISIYMISSPEFTTAENVSSGIELKWNNVQGASGYRLYRKTEDSSWKMMTDTASASYTDTDNLAAGKVYYYFVQAYHGSDESFFDENSDGTAVRKFANPTLSKAENTADGIKVTWQSVENADGYYVYRKTSGSSWIRLADVSSSSYTDSQNLSTGTKYTYTVRAYENNGTNINRSWYDSKGVSAIWVETPDLISAESTASGTLVKWNPVKGATSYRFYRKTDGGEWIVLADTTATSYTDKSSFSSGTKYIYTVRAYKGNDRSYFHTDGIAVTKLGNPSLTGAENASGGIKVSWKAVSGAEGYYVYRKTSGSSWVRLASVSAVSYTDSDVLTNGTKYIYTVRAFKGGDRSWYNSTGVSEVKIDIPKLISAENASGGISVKWNAVKNTTGYRIYRKPAGGTWKHIATTASTNYTDKSSLTNGTTYLYTVRALKGDDLSWYDADGVAELKMGNPSISAVENTSSGIKVTWKALNGADGYRVYRRTSGGSWVRLVDSTTDLSYTDKSALTSGTNYIYTVRAYKGSEWSWYNSGTSVTKLDIPTLSKAENNAGGIKVTWNSVKGASSYRVFRKPAGGSWKHIATTASTNYTDKSSLTNGTTYLYTVRALKGDDLSWYDTDGVAELKMSNPSISAVENTANGIKVTWKALNGADGYRVYRRTSGGSWVRLIDSTAALSYTDKSALTSGTNYIYTVRAYKGSEWSWYNSGTSVTKLSIPSLTKAENNVGGIKITWKSVKGASSYRIFRKPAGGSWKHIATTSSTTYTDKSSLTSGSKYTYTVRALKGSSLSWYNTSGVTETKLSNPSLSSAQKVSGGVKINWGSVKGATGYYVYRKPSGGSWTRIASTKSTSYTDKTTNINYIYTVRAYKGSDMSWYNSSGIRVITNKMLSKAQSFSSSTKWLILVDTSENKVGIYYGSKGNWTQQKYWDCTSGAASTPTVKGSFTVQSKGLAFGSGYTCWYYTQFYGNYLFHSVLYNPGSMTSIQDGRLGINASHGCVRLSLTNAKWIYDNIPRGTKVYIY